MVERAAKSQTKAAPPPARLARKFQLAWIKAAERTKVRAKAVMIPSEINNLTAEHAENAEISEFKRMYALVKNRHPYESRIGSGAGSGVQDVYKVLKLLDSGFRRNDEKAYFHIFYENIKFLSTIDYIISCAPALSLFWFFRINHSAATTPASRIRQRI